jgi:hypothetical protein
MIWISHDIMIEEFDLKELTGSDEIARYTDIRFGRLWFTTGMVVGHYGGRGAGDNCQTEYFPWRA